ncbi:hypothetical protein [Simiduia agarivorans]|uniref:Uncharacterized protein n=1 Tax=Simiduia agarivorans (strain DSM 21679 / JCM 13881 / BCRC 17597 / SA1) TaxID=1117647 RepID=K4KFH3_SIMAS|nr:hypothetical protein [Simiduia agarivorans]AFU97824.1 hypothetical protein M5M_03065 [Simiduia agarivorans SA1 = DSM 21679]
MADMRIPPIAAARTKVEPVSQTLPKAVPVDQQVELPAESPNQERRKRERRKGRAYRRPLVELRSGEDRRHNSLVDTDA